MKYQKMNITVLLLGLAGLVVFLFSDSNESSLINFIFFSTSVFLIVTSILSLMGKLTLSGLLGKLLLILKIVVFLFFLLAGFLMIRESFMQVQRDNETENALQDSGYYK